MGRVGWQARMTILRLVIIPLFLFLGVAVLVACSFYYFPLLSTIVSSLVLAGLYLKKQIKNQNDRERGWRVGRFGRDSIYYDELRNGSWQRIVIGGEMLTTRRPKHRIYFNSSIAWPSWAGQRQEEIIARIKEVLHEPDYQYC